MQTKICVLKGGISPEREVSLKSGEAVEEGLKEAGYAVFNLDTANGNFFRQLAKEKPDVVFIALHGSYGEDGTIQGWLELVGIPYTGSGVLASALAMDKISSKRIFSSQNLSLPHFQGITRNEGHSLNSHLSFPLVVKPARSGSTLGVSLLRDGNELELERALERAFQYDRSFAILEEYIEGKEITVGIIDDPEPRSLPIIQIIPKNELFNYQAKYTKGFCEYIVPAPISQEESVRVKEAALKAYESLGCRDFARVDMILREGVAHILEVNTIPGMTKKSLLPLAAHAEGLSFPVLVDKIVKSAFRRTKK